MIFSLLGIIFTFLFIIDMRFSQQMTYILWFVYLIFLLIYLKDFIKKVQKNRQKLIIGIIKYFPGLFFWLFGFILTTTIFSELFGFEVRLIGIFLQIIGLILLFFFFIRLPPFSEFDWYEAIEEIMVMNNAGLVIFDKKTHVKKEGHNEFLVGGALKHVKIILENIMESGTGGISIFEKKGKTIIIYQSREITGVIFSSKNLRMLQKLLQNFITRIESIYANIIPKWTGELSIFEPIEFIYNEMFKDEK